MADPVSDGVRALRARAAVADLSTWRRLRIAGADAAAFLGDLVTGPVEGLHAGAATFSLLLTPTGRIRAGFTVARLGEGFLVVQDPGQADPVKRLLEPYVLSSDVTITDVGAAGPLVAVVADDPPRGSLGTGRYAPGALGVGTDLLGVAAPDAAAALDLPVASPEAVETWRILEGRPRVGPDLGPESLPHEAPGLEAAIDFTKGCYLGQEAVARVRNLGHPPFVLRSVVSEGALAPGDRMTAGEEEAGVVTSAAADPDGGWSGLVRVRWEFRDAELRAAGRRPPSG